MNFKRFTRTRRWIIVISLACSAIIIGAGAVALAAFDFIIGAACSIVAIALLALYSIFGLSPLMRNYKNIIIEETLSDYVKEIEFEKSRFNKEFIVTHPMFPINKYYSSKYYFLANYKGLNFEIANVSTYTEVKSKNVYIKKASFSGKLFSIPIKTDETAKILIIEKKDHNSSALKRLKNSEFCHVLKTKSEHFNESYELYATKADIEINDFVQLLINVIKKLRKTCDNRVILLLQDNRLYLAIEETKGSYEPTLKAAVNTDDVNDLRKEYTPFFVFMDSLFEEIKTQ